MPVTPSLHITDDDHETFNDPRMWTTNSCRSATVPNHIQPRGRNRSHVRHAEAGAVV